MHQVTIHEAKTNLSKLIQEALMGEEVIIAKGKHPLINLEVLPGAIQKRRIGGLKDLVINISDNFNDPLDASLATSLMLTILRETCSATTDCSSTEAAI